ncbi:MAG: DNA polymerase Y family protein [Actinomycetaceae bacterium]|nr:DNA polymerase Y family protein [Actinomycetaceae bacterium]
MSRLMVVTFPYWPLAALVIDAPPDQPCVQYERGKVTLVSPLAHTAGIVKGISLKRAYDLCPYLYAVQADPLREQRAFDTVATIVNDIVAHYHLYRPGIIVLPVASVQGMYGSEENLAQILSEYIAEKTGAETTIGVASGLLSALLAGKEARFVQQGHEKEFLAPYPLSSLKNVIDDNTETREMIEQLHLLGVTTLKDIQRLGPTPLVRRFGVKGGDAYHLACGGNRYIGAFHHSAQEFFVRRDVELHHYEAIVMAYRHLSVQLCCSLRRAHKLCKCLVIRCKTADGRFYERTWMMTPTASDTDIAQRCHWQVSGWLGQLTTITSIELEASETIGLGCNPQTLWGKDHHKERISRSAHHIQSLLGEESVVVPRLVGGFEPRGRIDVHPFKQGEEKIGTSFYPTETMWYSWQGQIVEPAPPIMLQHPQRCQVCANDGSAIHINDYGILSKTPAYLYERSQRLRITDIHGPWRFQGRWWQGGHERFYSRFFCDDLYKRSQPCQPLSPVMEQPYLVQNNDNQNDNTRCSALFDKRKETVSFGYQFSPGWLVFYTEGYWWIDGVYDGELR